MADLLTILKKIEMGESDATAAMRHRIEGARLVRDQPHMNQPSFSSQLLRPSWDIISARS